MEHIQLMVLANLVMIGMLAMVIAFAGIFLLEVEWDESSIWFFSSLASYLGLFLLSLEIPIINFFYKKVAIRTTSRENHRIDTVFEDVLIAKLAVLAVFLFVNSYASLYYIAFVQPFVAECTYTWCLDSLVQSLAIIFCTLRETMRPTALPEEGEVGAAVAAVARARGPRRRKGKKAKGRLAEAAVATAAVSKGGKKGKRGGRGKNTSTANGGTRQASVGEEGRVGSASVPEEGRLAKAAVVAAGGLRRGNGKRRGGRGKGRGRKASTAKNGLPSGPMPRGLANAAGDNHCFLNVVVQSLWHVDAFRESINGNSNSNTTMGAKTRAWGAAVVEASKDKVPEETIKDVESALRTLFRELSGGEGGGGKVEGERAGITGTTSASVEALRVALAKVPGERFALGEMEDSAEALETILGCLAQGASAVAIRKVFGMRIREMLLCPKCGISSPEVPTSYEANVLYVHVSALQEGRKKNPVCSFDVALGEASLGDLLTCSNVECHGAQRRERLPGRRSITGEPPAVFSLGLVWSNWGPGPVADLLEMISPTIDLDLVFGQKRGGGGVPKMAWPSEEDICVGKAHLIGLHCFDVRKHHYVAFVRNRGRGEWLLVDDDRVIPIGPKFSGVLARCKKDELHPSLFFYERQPPLA